MADPTRRLLDPVPQEDGSQVTHSFATPVAFRIRGAVHVGSRKVIPVIFVPGTMGTNLRVRRDIPLPPDYPLEAGDPAWRPPNGMIESVQFADLWGQRAPFERQLILHPDLVEVDDTGDLDVASCNLSAAEMRARGWGELHHGSYGPLLWELQSHLEMTFRVDAQGKRHIRRRWLEVISALRDGPRQHWSGRAIEALTDSELEHFAGYQYPVYAVGYNWLRSCGESAGRLEQRVREMIAWWRRRRHDCDKVILLTHSMGGLVARACAQRIPDQIAGVVHGVMPAFGAPLAYRRFTCGTESSYPGNGALDNYIAGRFADVGGRTTEATTPVLAVAPGAIELLPNRSYPQPWLHIRVTRASGPPAGTGYLQLPNESSPNPYQLYRDMESWYRLINPALANPAGLYQEDGGVKERIGLAIDSAESFHDGLGDYHHPVTFAFYGQDPAHVAYGQIHWVAQLTTATSMGLALTPADIRKGRYLVHDPDGARTVEIGGEQILTFRLEQQEAAGDDTVPFASGAGVKARLALPTRGYRHQDCYKDRRMILLTFHFIVKIVQASHGNA